MPDNLTNPNRQLRCLQVNLRHSKIASASLAEVISENNIDVILRPSIKDVVTQFNSGIGGILTNLSIVAVDSNAMNKVWNSKCTNATGTELESVFLENCLQILNQPLDQLDFLLLEPHSSISRWLGALSKPLAGFSHLFPPCQTIPTFTLKLIIGQTPPANSNL